MFTITVNVTSTRRGWIAGFNAQHQIISFATELSRAKTFKTEKAALAFAVKHMDIGYGLSFKHEPRVVFVEKS